MAESQISHMSDTARWIAVYRANETAREDADDLILDSIRGYWWAAVVRFERSDA